MDSMQTFFFFFLILRRIFRWISTFIQPITIRQIKCSNERRPRGIDFDLTSRSGQLGELVRRTMDHVGAACRPSQLWARILGSMQGAFFFLFDGGSWINFKMHGQVQVGTEWPRKSFRAPGAPCTTPTLLDSLNRNLGYIWFIIRIEMKNIIELLQNEKWKGESSKNI